MGFPGFHNDPNAGGQFALAASNYANQSQNPTKSLWPLFLAFCTSLDCSVAAAVLVFPTNVSIKCPRAPLFFLLFSVACRTPNKTLRAVREFVFLDNSTSELEVGDPLSRATDRVAVLKPSGSLIFLRRETSLLKNFQWSPGT